MQGKFISSARTALANLMALATAAAAATGLKFSSKEMAKLKATPAPELRAVTPKHRRKTHRRHFGPRQRGHMAKAFRNYAVRYTTVDARLAERDRLEQEARVQARSGRPDLAKVLMDRSATFPW